MQGIDLNGGLQDIFSIGNTPSICLDLVLRNTTDTIFTTNQVKVEIGLKFDNKVEYIPLGIFNIADVKKDDFTTKFTCYDNMFKFDKAYFSKLGNTATLAQVVSELASITGVQFIGSLPSYSVKKLEGFTCREILSYVASLCGGNAIITRDGKFTIIYPTDVNRDIGEGVFDLKRDEVKYKVGKVICQADENNILSKGSLGADSMELQFENPWVTDSILTDIYNRLNGFSYLGYTMKWQGDLSLDIGDVVTYTDVKGVTRKLPILNRKLSYDGGLDSELSAKGETKNKNSFSSSGSTTNKVNRLVTEQAVIKEALIEKANIFDLKATNAEIANLKAKDVEIENALIKKATIEQLNATNANIKNLIAEDARINTALINKADIIQLNAVNGKINVLESDTANIKNLLAGNISGESGQLIHLTASNVTIADAVIKNLIASKISVADLQAGKISTNKFNIASDDGGITIVGPTMQFKDKSNKVRLQLGQDTQGNFNFILRGEDGTTTLIDHTGIKEKAIADNLIKEKMIAENAVGEKQINYSSLVTGLNKDTNTSLIEASKVAIDLTGQSLEVSFNSLKSNVDSKESRNLLIGEKLIIQAGTVTKEKISDYHLKFTNTHLNNTHIMWNGSNGITIDAKAGEYITVSFFIKSSFKTQCKIIGKSGITNIEAKTYNVVASEDLQKVVLTSKVLIDNPEIFIYFSDYRVFNEFGVLEIKDWKLEIGENSNPVWSIAPEDVDKKIESNTTAITVAQGKIEGLIKESSITKGDITTLEDNYTNIKATVDGINTTVASHTTSITNAQNTANSANSLADSKAKVFTSTPTTPYKVGDIWTGGPSGEIMKCKVSRTSGSYVASDWEKASKYTDDTKANAVEGNLNTLNGKVTTVENKQATLEQNLNGFKTTVANTYSTKTELSGVDGKVSGLTSRVSTAESSITQLNNKIDLKVEATEVNTIVNNAVDNVQIGGRNLLIGTSTIKTIPINTTNGYIAIDVYGTADSNSDARNGKTFSELGFVIGDKITVRFDWSTRQNGSAAITNGSYRVELRKNGTYKGGISSITNFNTNKGVAEYYHTFTTNTLDSNQLCVRIDNSILLFDISNCKLEKGTKPTYWTPAPEDVEASIDTVDTKIETTNNKVATIETNLSNITQRVSSTESTVNTINGNVTNLTSRVSTAESKLTATSLTTTISSAINGGTSSITTTQFVMDKNGLTIKNGALTIKNKANSNVLTSDTNGNLTITGTFINKSNNGVDAIKIDSTNIYFYDWERNGRELGVIYSSYITDYPNVRGFSLAHNQQGYMTLGYRTGTNSFGHYITFDKYAKNPSYAAPIRVHESAVFHSAVNIQDRVYIPAKICFEGNYNATTPQIFKNTSDSRNILCTQVSVNAKNDGFMIQSNTGSKLFSIEAGYSYPIILNNNVQINGSYTATGSKNSLQYTEHYGERLINAYETAEYFFGDIGSGVIKDGECIVWIDDILQECINTDVEYHIFTQVYNGVIIKIERFKNYFIVFGEDNTKFSWELKAKRLGYENIRLDQPDIQGYLDNTPVFTEEDLIVETSEDILMQELEFKLEDLLLKESA